jgi:hypothetical protein
MLYATHKISEIAARTFPERPTMPRVVERRSRSFDSAVLRRPIARPLATRWTTKLVGAFAVLVLIASGAASAKADTNFFSTGGCSGYGQSASYYAGGKYALTDSSPHCNWHYLSCSFVVGGNVVTGCPGWVNFAPLTVHTGASAVFANHSLCQAGGPCTGSQYYGTSSQ